MKHLRASRTSIKTKAIECLKELKIYKPYIDEFKKSGTVTMFERYAGFYQDPQYGAGDMVYNLIKKVEKEHNCLVYAITHEINLEIGEMYSFLIIPNESDKYESYIAKCNNNSFYVFAYVYNVTYPEFSEIGDIVVDCFGGGIRRIG